MLISGKYRLAGGWNPGQNAIVAAEEVSSGDRVLLHFLDPGNPDHQLLQQQAQRFLADVPPESRSQPFDLGKHEGALFLVTPALPEFKALDESGIQDWIQWQIKGNELRSRLRQSAHQMRDLREHGQSALGQANAEASPPKEVQASSPDPVLPSNAPSAEANEGSADSPASAKRPGISTIPSQSAGDKQQVSLESSRQDEKPGDFTRLFQQPGRESSPALPEHQQASASSRRPEAPPTTEAGDFTGVFAPQRDGLSPPPTQQDRSQAGVEQPPSEPPEKTDEQAGDFTNLFSPGPMPPAATSSPPGSSPNQPSAKQPAASPGSDQQAGDFTRLFQESPQASVPPPQAAEPPPAPQPSAGSRLPDDSDAKPQSPQGAPQVDPAPESPGGFTQMWGGLNSDPAPSESQANSLPWEGGTDQNKAPGDFTRLFRDGSAASPAAQPPSPPSWPSGQSQKEDEFSRMFGSQQPGTASPAGSGGSGADATRIFEDRSQGLPNLGGAQDSGPSEYTQFMQASSIPVNQGAADEGSRAPPPGTKPEADAALEVKKSKDTKPGASLNYLILALVFCALLLLALAAIVFFSPSDPPPGEMEQTQSEASPAEGSNAAASPSTSGTSPVRTPSARGPSMTGPSVRGPSISGTSVTKPSLRKPTLRKPSMTRPSARLSTSSSRGAAQPAATSGSNSPLLAVILALVAFFLIAAAVVVYFALVKKPTP